MYYSVIMRRISLKIVLCVVSCVWGVVYLSGCVKPIDLSSFVGDEEVLDIIDKSAGTVNITLDSASGLSAGNQKITGLDSSKYYMVEEWVENGNFQGVQFVSSDGTRSTNLAEIGRVDGGEITGLTNRYHYRVKSAGPLLDDVAYQALTPPGSTQSAPNTNGAITLPGPEDDSFIIYTLTPPSSPSYDIVEIPISPAGSAKPAMRPTPNGDMITLISRETVIDYVFFGTISDATFNFYVLRVTSDPEPVIPPEPGWLEITVTLLPYTGDNPPDLTATAISYPQNDTGTINFTVNNSSQYDNNSFIWYIDGTQVVGTGHSFSLNKGLPQYKIVGDYIITVIASQKGIPYSAAIEVEVRE